MFYILIIRDKERHAYLRRIFQPNFSSESLKRYEPTAKRYCAKLISVIHSKMGSEGVVDMGDLFNRLTFDVPAPHNTLISVDRHPYCLSGLRSARKSGTAFLYHIHPRGRYIL